MQFVMMPPLYVCHDVASTPTDSGPFEPTHVAIWSSLCGRSMWPLIVAPVVFGNAHAGTWPPPLTYG